MGGAFWSLIVLFVYYEVDRWTPLGDWNGNYSWAAHNDQAVLDLVVGAALLLAIVSFKFEFKIGMVLATLALAAWAFMHLQSWWIPYYQGVYTSDSIAFHAQFLNHTQVLPKIDNHYPPDAEHSFIDLFLLVALVRSGVATVMSFFGAES